MSETPIGLSSQRLCLGQPGSGGAPPFVTTPQVMGSIAHIALHSISQVISFPVQIQYEISHLQQYRTGTIWRRRAELTFTDPDIRRPTSRGCPATLISASAMAKTDLNRIIPCRSLADASYRHLFMCTCFMERVHASRNPSSMPASSAPANMMLSRTSSGYRSVFPLIMDGRQPRTLWRTSL